MSDKNSKKGLEGLISSITNDANKSTNISINEPKAQLEQFLIKVPKDTKIKFSMCCKFNQIDMRTVLIEKMEEYIKKNWQKGWE